MKCTKLLLMAGALLFLGAGAVKAAELTIYSDDFSGLQTAPLNGTAPGIRPGTETWTAATDYKADGSFVATALNSSSYLAFTPEAGKQYRLSVDVSNLANAANSDRWAGLGFANNVLGTQHAVNQAGRGLTALVLRQNGRVAALINGTILRDDTTFGPAETLTTVMTTYADATPWNVDFYVGETLYASGTLANGTEITRAALSFNGGSQLTGNLDNFTLTTIPEPAAQDLSFAVSSTHEAREIHVAVTGNDTHDGSAAAPLATVSAAAALAQPGDVVTVHEGVYRERIDPPRGGTPERPITYRAAPGEEVVICGSEVVTGWERAGNDTWKVVLPDAFFGAFNPFKTELAGDWFQGLGRVHHAGTVYMNGRALVETASMDTVLAPAGETAWWYTPAEQSGETTTIYAQFPGVDPAEATIEVAARQTVFYPSKPGMDHITVRGFVLRHAATPWAPPTAEQFGLVGTHWSKGWIIESNRVSHSRCVGIALGKFGDEFDNREASPKAYNDSIDRAVARGWSRERIGSHIVRNNEISYCGQAGIVGSMGGAFSTIAGNHIHHIWTERQFSGFEIAGIKLHGPVDTVIEGNLIHDAYRGIWLDWMVQGTRVSRNVLFGNDIEDLYMEVSHGPYVVDHNLFLSPNISLKDESSGGVFAHNLFGGGYMLLQATPRRTPYFEPHSTTIKGLGQNAYDNRFFNNLFVGGPAIPDKKQPNYIAGRGYGLKIYETVGRAIVAHGNVYLGARAEPPSFETENLVLPDFEAQIGVRRENGTVLLDMAFPAAAAQLATKKVTSDRLEPARVPQAPFENSDGSPIVLDRDFFGAPHRADSPLPGPFADTPGGRLSLRLWPQQSPEESPAAIPHADQDWTGNPLIPGKGVADPSVRIFNNKAYLYATHDTPMTAPERKGKGSWHMLDWQVRSSENLKDWRLEGTLHPTLFGFP